MIDYEEARRKVLARARPSEPEVVALVKAFGRVLAEDIKAKEPVPPFRKSKHGWICCALPGYKRCKR